VQIAARLIAPPLAGPIASVAGLMFGQAILSVAALGFLGLGLRPPVPEWGAMIVDALPYIDEAPVLLLVPAAAIILTVSALFLATGPAMAVKAVR
jgi:ABC-type dipeptide/oligopeptide/nickel transport system permease subunit